eukprot:m.119543 g.119543  ORF g.119543 m.119543 type:complete len:241 (-) comp28743_c0_seq2:1170-1892(-)
MSDVEEQEQEDVDSFEDLPFEIVQKIRDTIGMKRFNEIVAKDGGAESSPSKPSAKRKREGAKPLKLVKKPKSQPHELSSKHRSNAVKTRTILKNTAPKSKDPRFDERAGELDQSLFERTYKFLDSKKEQEQKQIMKELRKCKDETKRLELRQLLQRTQDQSTASAQQKLQKQQKSKRVKDEHKLMAKGKKPYFLKKSDAKSIQLLDKFEKMKQGGELKAKMIVRIKRNASKSKRNIPSAV